MSHSISNRNFCCFSCIIAMVHQNSPTLEFWQEKIDGNLRRANTEPSVDLRRANTEPSVDFKKANTEPSVLGGLLLGISLGLCRQEIPRSSPASPWKTPPFPSLLLRLTHYFSSTWLIFCPQVGEK